MSQKIEVNLQASGELDTNTNPTLLQGRGSRRLQNIGDLYGDGELSVPKGYSKLLGAPMLADYSTGTVTVSPGSITVTGSATVWTDANGLHSNAFSGDLFFGPDSKWYTVDRVLTTTSLELAQPYEGTAAAGATYKIRHKVWMMAPFYAAAGSERSTYSADLENTTDGTLTGVESTALGVSITPTSKVYLFGGTITKDSDHDSGADYLGEGWGPSVSYRTVNHAYICPGNPWQETNVFSYNYIGKVAGAFSLQADITTGGIFVPINAILYYAGKYWYPTPGDPKVSKPLNKTLTFLVKIYADNAGAVGTQVTNATTGEVVVGTGGADTYYPWASGTVTLTAGVKYWIVIEKGSTGWITAPTDPCTQHDDHTEMVFSPFSDPESSGVNTAGVNLATKWPMKVYYTARTGAATGWQGTSNPKVSHPNFAFLVYPTTGTHTYMTKTIDVGYTPGAAGTLSIDRVYAGPYTLTDVEIQPCPGYKRQHLSLNPASMVNALETGDTLTWALHGSDDDTTWNGTGAGTDSHVIVTGQTALTYSITNYYRYYRVVLTMASTAGVSTPLVKGLTIAFSSSANEAKETNTFVMIGCGRNVYTQPKAGASTVIATYNPAGNAQAVQYLRKFFWVSAGHRPLYWDGIAAAAALVDDLAKEDASAGVNPPVRCDGLALHNDKLFWHRNVGLTYKELANDTVTATQLNDATGAFTTTGTGYQGYRVYPDVSNYPLRWWVITANTGTQLTMGGATITSVAADTDNYMVTRNYRKAAWYSTEREPADTPTANLLVFGDEAGDLIQRMVSWKGRLVVVTSDEIWRITGYGPDTPWEKEFLARGRGTLSPLSVVDSGEELNWWTTEGIVSFSGGYGKPDLISNRVRAVVLDDVNEKEREGITGVHYQGRTIWSYPSGSSNINNRLLIYNPTTRRFLQRDFGMYSPCVMVGEDREEMLLFWEPTTGCICQYDDGYMLGGQAQSMVWRSSFVTASHPAEMAQFLYLRATIVSGETLPVQVSYALDYGDAYTSAGTLTPLSATVTGRTTVNPSDKVYECRFPAEVRGVAISIELSAQTTGTFRVLNVDIIADPVEAMTSR